MVIFVERRTRAILTIGVVKYVVVVVIDNVAIYLVANDLRGPVSGIGT